MQICCAALLHVRSPKIDGSWYRFGASCFAFGDSQTVLQEMQDCFSKAFIGTENTKILLPLRSSRPSSLARCIGW
jgi:hypothetical protein